MCIKCLSCVVHNSVEWSDRYITYIIASNNSLKTLLSRHKAHEGHQCCCIIKCQQMCTMPSQHCMLWQHYNNIFLTWQCWAPESRPPCCWVSYNVWLVWIYFMDGYGYIRTNQTLHVSQSAMRLRSPSAINRKNWH